MADVALRAVSKSFGALKVVNEFSLDISHGEFIVLVGPSGCGKSTTLRMVAGLEDVSSGQILFDGQIINHLNPRDRNVAMVFQNYALYPHMTVADNISFALSERRVPKDEIAAIVDRTAKLLGIETLLARMPKQLSGGQRQRVAMGRAIVRKPDVFLFDEPLSNLDAELRAQMRLEIKRLHRLLGSTVIYVTHDQIEAMTLADRIVVMDNGEIVQIGRPMEIYNHPSTRFVAGFIGSPRINFVSARVDVDKNGHLSVALPSDAAIKVPASRVAEFARYKGQSVELGLRPEHIRQADIATQANGAIEATVEVIEPMGADTVVVFSIGTADLTVRLPPSFSSSVGDKLQLNIDIERSHLIDPVSKAVIRTAADPSAY